MIRSCCCNPTALTTMLAVVAAALLAAPHAAHGQVACRYEVAAVIQAPDGPMGASSPTQALAISPNGRYVVGYFNPGGFGFDRGFWFDMNTQQFHILPFPGDNYQSSYCNDVNDSGLIVGSLWYTIGPAVQRGYVFDLHSGQFVTQLMPLPGAAYAEATGINNAGQVCGTRSIGSKGDPANPRTAFIWSVADGFTDLGLINRQSTACVDINNEGLAVGGMSIGSIATPFLWDGGTPIPLPTIVGLSTFASEIKDDGIVVGVGFITTGSPSLFRAFVLQQGVIKILPPLAGFNRSSGSDMTPNGSVLGWSTANGGGPTMATIWVDAQPARLQDLVNGVVALERARASSSTGSVLADLIGTGACVVTPSYSPADLNGDCRVSVPDLLRVILDWGLWDSPADLNHDGAVNELDLLIVIEDWTK